MTSVAHQARSHPSRGTASEVAWPGERHGLETPDVSPQIPAQATAATSDRQVWLWDANLTELLRMSAIDGWAIRETMNSSGFYISAYAGTRPAVIVATAHDAQRARNALAEMLHQVYDFPERHMILCWDSATHQFVRA